MLQIYRFMEASANSLKIGRMKRYNAGGFVIFMALERRKPLPALTGIRIFAAYYVVLLHTASGYIKRHGFPHVTQNFARKGYLVLQV
jgi:hypothetical protein